MIDVRNIFEQPSNNDIKTYQNIRIIAIGQGDKNANGYQLDYPYFEEIFKFIAMELSKQ